MERQKVKVELINSNFWTRWPCHVCGGGTDKVPILAEVTEGPHKGFRVCEQCIEKRDFDTKILKHADSLEKNAAYLRSLVGRLEVPTYEEYLKREDEFNRTAWPEDFEKNKDAATSMEA